MSKGEDSRIVKRVGAYTTNQAEQNDCERCHDATWGTVLIDGLCLDCYVGKMKDKDLIRKFQTMCEESLCPETFERFEFVRDELLKTRHIPKDAVKLTRCSRCGVMTDEWSDVEVTTNGDVGVYCPECFAFFSAELESKGIDRANKENTNGR